MTVVISLKVANWLNVKTKNQIQVYVSSVWESTTRCIYRGVSGTPKSIENK